MTAVNLAGEGVILGARYLDPEAAATYPEEMADRYAATPVFQLEDIPNGRHVHIGEGVWAKTCRECGDYILTYGCILYMREIAAHEAAHGVKGILGWDVGILA